jgi:hypothetical protein
LAVLARAAAERVSLAVAGGDGSSRVLRFGEQMDTQPLTVGPTPTTAGDSSAEQGGVARRVAGYLAKYVTKSVAEFGLSPARMSAEAIEALELRDHVRAILTTLVGLACTGGQYAPMLSWLHMLGYRGHITTKSRRFSVTMAALRARREAWRGQHPDHTPGGLVIGEPEEWSAGPAAYADPLQMVAEWSFVRVGHGARLIIIWPSGLRCGHANIAAWPATPTAMTWAATPTATTWPRSDTNIARVFVASDHGTTVFVRASDVRVRRESGRAGIWPDPTTAAGGLRALTEQLLPNPDRDASGCHG